MKLEKNLINFNLLTESSHKNIRVENSTITFRFCCRAKAITRRLDDD